MALVRMLIKGVSQFADLLRVGSDPMRGLLENPRAYMAINGSRQDHGRCPK